MQLKNRRQTQDSMYINTIIIDANIVLRLTSLNNKMKKINMIIFLEIRKTNT